MAIQYTPGPIIIDDDDVKLTHRDITIAIKIRVVSWPVIMGCKLLSDNSWESSVDLTGDLFASDVPGQADAVEYWVQYYGGPDNFVREVVIPNLNKWMADLWAPEEVDQMSALEQIQVSIQKILFTFNPDGTVIASI